MSKRARGSADDDGSDNRKIVEVLGVIGTVEGDSTAVADALAMKEFNINEWLNGLNLKKAEELKDLLLGFKDRGQNDFVIKAIAKFVPQMTALDIRYSKPQRWL